MSRTSASMRRMQVLSGAAALAVAGTGAAYAASLGDTGAANRNHGDQTAEVASQIKYGKAKNVILFIGDGMGDSEITVARNYLVGASGRLPGIDSLPLTGQYTTYALHKGGEYAGKPDYVTDSAASGTGWSTGTKSYNGAISVGLDGRTEHQTLLEWAKSQGLKTGDITTAEVQDATPAVELAHVADRGCYMPGTDKTKTVTVDGRQQFKGMVNCPDQRLSIEEQIVKARADVVMGGGRGWFEATDADGHKVYDDAKAAGYQIPETRAQLDAVTKADQTSPVLGLFASGNFQTRFKPTPATATGYQQAPQRCQTNDTAPDGSKVTWPGTQPTLAEMTQKSLDLLDNKSGFFLQVEGASIDKQDHAANACGQIGETKDLDDAVKVGMDFARTHGDTLVIVTADHGHTSQIINAEDIGADGSSSVPLAGTVNLLTADDAPMTVAYGTAQLNGSQQHTGTQVRVAGYGPGAANVVGLTDQTDLFNTIKGALSGVGLDKAPAPQVVTRTVTHEVVPARVKAEVAARITRLRHQLRHAHGDRRDALRAQLAAYRAVQRSLG